MGALAVATPVLAIDLNAPAVKQVTVGSEIRRGFDGARFCTRGDFNGWHDKFEAMLFENEQRNADTEAFLLGANFGFSYYSLASVQSHGDDTSVEVSFLRIFTKAARQTFEKKQKEMQLSDEELIRLLSIEPKNFQIWKGSNR